MADDIQKSHVAQMGHPLLGVRPESPRILAMILAGGKGERLMPLTEHRSKPAVMFGCKYRLVDFVLSNFLNSGITGMYVLVQYRAQSLIEHLRRAWRIADRLPHHFVSVVPPQMRARDGWYEGNADAVYHNLNLIRDFSPDLVAVFGADHIYRMDISQMVRFHLERRADVTVAALPVPIETASRFGIIEVARERPGSASDRIVAFHEKPSHPTSMPNDPDYAFSSMGNYLFSSDLLCEVLARDADRPGSHDFGRDIIPQLLRSHRVLAYNFRDNALPGLEPHEETSYWRDVGTLDSYWRAHMDLLGEHAPFQVQNPAWPIWADNHDGPPAAFVDARVDDSLVGQSSRLVGASVRRSVIGRDVRIERGAQVEECILLDNTFIGAGSQLRRAIVDRFNHIPAGARIGFDRVADSRRFVVTDSGLVAIGQARLVAAACDPEAAAAPR